MKKLKLIVVVGLLLVVNSIKSQETLKVMYYNLLNFPSTAQTRADTLKKIVQYVLPDVFVVNELDNQFGATLILNLALNQNGITYYQQAAFVNGPDTDNLLFYNSNKLGLISQNEIPTALRDINEYVMYYKAPDLAVTQDTVYFYFYSCHLKAGSDSPPSTTNMDLRLAESQVLKNYLSTRPNLQNVMVGGDFNFYGSSVSGEPAVNEILNGGSVPLYDPMNMMGEWHVNSFFANIHTQSTRTTSFNGGATGGMDDRFDFIFINNDLQTGVNRATYVNNSYKSVGQDGLHYNTSLVNPLNNGVVPAYVANALHEMSDHLPVYLEIDIAPSVGITENDLVSNFRFNSETHKLDIFLEDNIDNSILTVYDLTGKKVIVESHQSTSHIQTYFPSLKSGIYIVNLSSGDSHSVMKVVVL